MPAMHLLWQLLTKLPVVAIKDGPFRYTVKLSEFQKESKTKQNTSKKQNKTAKK